LLSGTGVEPESPSRCVKIVKEKTEIKEVPDIDTLSVHL